MKLIWTYMKHYSRQITFVVAIKFIGTLTELLIPYVLEHMIDDVAPTKRLWEVFLWGGVMLGLALFTRFLNITANRHAAKVSRDAAYEIRRDLYFRTVHLSGGSVDEFGLPSLTSRMTSDSYNVQNFMRFIQSLGIRAPIQLIGGIAITLTMDAGLAAILCVVAPIMICVVVCISRKGIPLYDVVQQKMDDVVRVMRENITGIRVVKALSKENYERRRFEGVNRDMADTDRRAGTLMALPGPLMSLALNVSLTLVVVIGAKRVNAGVTQPGVILAFLTYFNMILMGIMGLNRLFIMLSKASASANRIGAVIAQEEDLPTLPAADCAESPDSGFLVFDHVSFRYGGESAGDSAGFNGEERKLALSDISFSVKKGGSLGIIGPTGCGKTTVINLLMRFYDATEGAVYVDGHDVRTYEKQALRRRFGTVFQNDTVFADSFAGNISFGRDLTGEEIRAAAADACASEFMEAYEEGYGHTVAIRGADLSGGQRQRVLLSRALAGSPEILVLDDASSALDYRTDAALRKAIREHFADTTTVIIAQRISSILNSDEILVMDDGEIVGRGTHEELLRSCPQYLEIYRTQMGEGVS